MFPDGSCPWGIFFKKNQVLPLGTDIGIQYISMAKKILIVDDDAGMILLLSADLKKAGYKVCHALDGEEGLRQVQKEQPDLVICDVVMPIMDGNQFLKKLRESNSSKTPFIILTVHASMKDYFELMQVDDFIIKPFTLEDLLARIQDVFDRKGAPKNLNPEDVLNASAIDWITTRDGKITGGQESGPVLGRQIQDGMKNESMGNRPVVKKKVLIMEDDTLTCQEIQKILSLYGCETMVAQTLEKCMEIAIEAPVPDLIILKYFLNQKNVELFATHLKQVPQLEQVPIIIYENIHSKVDKEFIWNEEGRALIRKVKELLKK